jgi:hypothetical protein
MRIIIFTTPKYMHHPWKNKPPTLSDWLEKGTPLLINLSIILTVVSILLIINIIKLITIYK